MTDGSELRLELTAPEALRRFTDIIRVVRELHGGITPALQDYLTAKGSEIGVNQADIECILGSISIGQQAEASHDAQDGEEPAIPWEERGQNLYQEMVVSLEDAYFGREKTVDIASGSLTVQIPRGIGTGARMRLEGKGNPGVNDGPAGDLYLNVQVLPHARFERKGDDLYADVTMPGSGMSDNEIEVPTLDGRVIVRNTPQMTNGSRVRLQGKGMPRLNAQSFGDLYVRLRMVANTLTSAIGIETAGGIFTPLIPAGTALPSTFSETFTTYSDGQQAVTITIYQGKNSAVNENTFIGSFDYYGIPNAPKGVPKIEVTFHVTEAGELTVTAKDLATGRESSSSYLVAL